MLDSKNLLVRSKKKAVRRRADRTECVFMKGILVMNFMRNVFSLKKKEIY